MKKIENFNKYISKLKIATIGACAFLFMFVPSLYAYQGFGPGVNQNQMTSGAFSDAVYPLDGDFNATTYAGHSGAGSLDFNKGNNTKGQAIYAVEDGTVQYASDSCPSTGFIGNSCGNYYGNHVIIDHGNGFDTLYGHMLSGSVNVRQGQQVKKGDIIGYVGSSGNSSGPHLHFEIRQNNRSVPVTNYFYIPNVQQS